MARTKQTARRQGPGPNIAAKATKGKAPRKPGKSMHILMQPRMRRINRSLRMFSEIRKAQDCTELCMPKTPFQRLTRSICGDLGQGTMRWNVTALLTLQEAAEDFLVEYFNDICIAAAHAHRVTIMDKDSCTVKRMRWRYDKLLEPTAFIDKKMKDLLVIPPVRRGKDKVKIEDVTHNVNTRAKARFEEGEKLKQEAQRRDEVVEEDRDYLQCTLQLSIQNMADLRRFRTGCYVCLPFYTGERSLSLDRGDIDILKTPGTELNDTIVYAMIR